MACSRCSSTAHGWRSVYCWRGEISFARFKQQLELTDGNLGAQLRKLEDAGCIALRRDFVDRKPVTWYALTKPGRLALNRHLRALQSIISEASQPSSVST